MIFCIWETQFIFCFVSYHVLNTQVQLHFPCPLRTESDPDALENMFSFSFVEEPQFTFTAETAVGNRVHLSSEKLASILTTNIRKALINKCVQPAKISFHMFPDLVKQRKLQLETQKLLSSQSSSSQLSSTSSTSSSSLSSSTATWYNTLSLFSLSCQVLY